MPNADPTESESEQRYLRLDVEVTSSRVVSGKGLGDHEQVIRFPLMPADIFDNSTTSLTSSKAAEATPAATAPGQSSSSSRRQRTSYQARSSRVNAQGGVAKARRIYDTKDQLFKNARAAASRAGSSASRAEASTPLTPIKEEPMEIYIKEEPMD
ncbi:hypothetical protein BG011_003497 [Mortierella polycephala]|uniref:Uncharacterized protein n=1 Tax=Mortierella polycephala TaxID=41804 RepID=A0A9P6TUB3_9FUNG|nr:hypothetical protein BG011_003497 [Mortierella polycephala]